jgi:hypothetical protein
MDSEAGTNPLRIFNSVSTQEIYTIPEPLLTSTAEGNNELPLQAVEVTISKCILEGKKTVRLDDRQNISYLYQEEIMARNIWSGQCEIGSLFTMPTA